ncbi:MAG: bifunctional oligoribonuclease/PAP phosphatase NrnA [Candidatus Dormibacteraeota bacterium]|nr:bifunctional oligoribonuclease/PAP phosphatase NrnA [Candidatus Dormibacteraeota bacterium]
MTSTTIQERATQLQGLLRSHDEILIFGHKDADGDTLGCSLAFAEALRAQGKTVHVVIPPPLPGMYSWMPGYERIVEDPPPGADTGLVLFFDAGNMERSGSAASRIGDRATIVNIDHHTSNSMFGNVNIIDPDAAAVGQMCLDMMTGFGWEITPSMATNLYTALMTDTGGFRHENTNARALADGARLAALGADPSAIATMVYKSRPLTTLKLTGLAMAGLRVEMDGRLAYARVTRRMLREAGAVMAESEGIIDSVNSIDGIDVGVLFKEVTGTLTKISVRTRGPVDAAALCARFGGGGHVRAAGAEIHRPLDEAAEQVLAAAREAIAEAADAGRRSQRR